MQLNKTRRATQKKEAFFSMTKSTDDSKIEFSCGMLMTTWTKPTPRRTTWKKMNQRMMMHVTQTMRQMTHGTWTNPTPSWLIWSLRPMIWRQMIWRQMVLQFHQWNRLHCDQGGHRGHPDPENPWGRGRR
jgi:hypothetical protein